MYVRWSVGEVQHEIVRIGPHVVTFLGLDQNGNVYYLELLEGVARFRFGSLSDTCFVLHQGDALPPKVSLLHYLGKPRA